MKKIEIILIWSFLFILSLNSFGQNSNKNSEAPKSSNSESNGLGLTPNVNVDKKSKFSYSVNLNLKQNNKKKSKFRDTVYYDISKKDLRNDSIFKKRSPLENFYFGVKLSSYDFFTANYIQTHSLSEALNTKNINTDFGSFPIAVGVTFLKKINNHIDFMGGLEMMFLRDKPSPNISNPTLDPNPRRFYGTADFTIISKLFPNNYIVSPFASYGIGVSFYEGASWEPYLPIGLGLQFRLSKDVYLNTSIQNKIPVNPSGFSHITYTANLYTPLHKIFRPKHKLLKNLKDTVGDRDKDGILDTADMCIDTPGLKRYKGCPIPDTDKDGINDEIDKCPTVKGIKKYRGCPPPDTDGDGIIDEQDSCPYKKGVARYFGCPVPDFDKDSVSDEEDLCPTVKGLVSNFGCPDYSLELLKIGNRFYFETAKSDLLEISKIKLTKIVNLLSSIPPVEINLAGNTDTIGSYNYNLALSFRRANSVKAFLTNKGISEKTINIMGYSFTKPIASNKLVDGRSLNRRVDLTINLKDSLIKIKKLKALPIKKDENSELDNQPKTLILEQKIKGTMGASKKQPYDSVKKEPYKSTKDSIKFKPYK
ncbi:MAG: OmpA family protein, partial [Sediminibacterium sp.]|nr:OmpA family protein [Sediminibacterium sp.]